MTVVRQLLRGNHHVGDAEYAGAVAHFGVPGTVQIAATTGYVAVMSIIANAFELAPAGEATTPAFRGIPGSGFFARCRASSLSALPRTT